MKLLIPLMLSTTLASADQFDEYAIQNNTQRPMTVLTGEAARLYKAEYNATDPGEIIFGTAKWKNNLGVAPFVLNLKKKTHTGYMAFLLDENEKVKSLMWTHGQPEESWTTWELEASQAADIGSTLFAFSQGFAEANPLAQGAAFPVIAAVKIAGTYYFKRTSLQKCQASTMASGIGTGTAVLNGITIAVGSFAPWALIPAALIGYVASPKQNEAFWDCVALFSNPNSKTRVVAEPEPSIFLAAD